MEKRTKKEKRGGKEKGRGSKVVSKTLPSVLREFSAGGAVFKKLQTSKTSNVQILWLVAKSAPSSLYPDSYWRLPKGWLDDERGGNKPGPLGRGDKKPGEKEIQEAAVREVSEEGGVEAKVVKKIGTEKIFFTQKSGKKVLKFVTYYLMKYIRNLPSGPSFETSEVRFSSYKEARKLLKYLGEKKILDKAQELLSSGTQGNLV